MYVRQLKKTIKKCDEVYEHIFILVLLLLNETTKRPLVCVEVY